MLLLLFNSYIHIPRVESAHSVFKSEMDSRNNRLDTCLEHIHRMLRDEFRQLMASLEQSRIRIQNKVRNLPIFRFLLNKVSHHCISMLLETFNVVCSGDYDPYCTNCYTRATYGIPCLHEVAIIAHEGRAFMETDVHVFWRQIHWFDDADNEPSDPRHVDVNEVAVDDLQEAIQSGELTDHEIMQIGTIWRTLRDPETIMLEAPDTNPNPKGRPKKGTNERRRSSFEYTREAMAKAREERERKRAAEVTVEEEEEEAPEEAADDDDVVEEVGANETPILTYPEVVIGKYEFGSNNFENFMVPYVECLVDVQGDGNCGFRALAVLLGRGEDKWPQIRRSMMKELRNHPDRYEIFLNFETLNHEQMMEKLRWFRQKVLAPSKHWMIMPICGALFATIYQCPLVYLDWNAASTILPLSKQKPPKGSPAPGSIGFIARDTVYHHYVAVSIIYLMNLKY